MAQAFFAEITLMAELPILVFPPPAVIKPQKGGGFVPSLHYPGEARQAERIQPQLDNIAAQFKNATLAQEALGIEPEMVLVIETIGSIEGFNRAVEKTDGLDWLGAEDIEDIEPDDDFYSVTKKEGKLSGRLLLCMSNAKGMEQLLSLWKKWQKGEKLPHNQGRWKEVFKCVKEIRRWGIQEQFYDSGMLDYWQENLEDNNLFQIEFFYRKDPDLRVENVKKVRELAEDWDGELLNQIDIAEIHFHAVKLKMPRARVQHFIEVVKNNLQGIDLVQTPPLMGINLLQIPSIMCFRPIGQAAVTVPDEENVGTKKQKPPPLNISGEPVAAILDGLPFVQHNWLAGRIQLDDPDGFEADYQSGERRHGTAMASLVIHGELDAEETPLTSLVYCHPVMKPKSDTQNRVESFPSTPFPEDLIYRAVRRMFEGEGEVPPQASTVKIINLSLGDDLRLFLHTPSPLARLLDWLSFKYQVLFVVSTGNYAKEIDLGVNECKLKSLQNFEKVGKTLKCVAEQLPQRRLLSPAESINALTVGALHQDKSGVVKYGYGDRREDLFPTQEVPIPKLFDSVDKTPKVIKYEHAVFSPINRLGYGFRRSVKPDILLPGGRQFYEYEYVKKSFVPKNNQLQPGQSVALESKSEGGKGAFRHTRGTSNATALATRAGVRIHDMLHNLEQGIPDAYQTVLIKTLLVHGASWGESYKILEDHLKDSSNSRRFKHFASRFLGYGAANIHRVLQCTEQRTTVIGYDTLKENQAHEYRFPLPSKLAGNRIWRRMTITLAWFTPINAHHHRYRKAKLFFSRPKEPDLLPLKRQEANYHQTCNGTVQHEILESKDISNFQEGDNLSIIVNCKKDATPSLDESIAYGLAVTLEVKEDIAIYQSIRDRIRTQAMVNI